ncbi:MULTISPECIES: hypothetical protein [unclassified Acidovorax]|uniref:hypothetical protein n=1 Tax=unclassified Acidovorax TaxID=2684926 RepID=UPI002882EE36|nr:MULTISPECIES: hypothetical protein [unclassified Acidovorax]
MHIAGVKLLHALFNCSVGGLESASEHAVVICKEERRERAKNGKKSHQFDHEPILERDFEITANINTTGASASYSSFNPACVE